jgi:hypothetical protein
MQKDAAEALRKRLQKYKIAAAITANSDTFDTRDLMPPADMQHGLGATMYVAIQLLTDAENRRAQLIGAHQRIKVLEEKVAETEQTNTDLRDELDRSRTVHDEIENFFWWMRRALVAVIVGAILGALVVLAIVVGAVGTWVVG